MSETAVPDRITVEVPSFLVDAAQLVVTPFTLHLTFGGTQPDGSAVPRAHVAMSAAFARDFGPVAERLGFTTTLALTVEPWKRKHLFTPF